MSHATEAKVAVQKVVALRLHRFGLESDVFPPLNEALAHLDAIIAEETIQPEAVAAVEVVEEAESTEPDAKPEEAGVETARQVFGLAETEQMGTTANVTEPASQEASEPEAPKRRARRKRKSRSETKS